LSKNLYIIDGHGQIYASYYAPLSASLTAPDGEPTKATLIFTTMIIKLLRQRQPDLLLVAMDAPGPTFRHKMYKEYKANRPSMPDDLPIQITRIEEILAAMRIQILRKAGFEADDLIGTVTKLAQKKKYQVVICSGDKDLEQLLADDVSIYNPRKDTFLDVAGLKEAKGITPDQVIDVMTLVGDTSDNIPGVPDVGPKTALDWIQKYGSLDNLLKNSDQIKGKRGENLRAVLEQLKLSRQLVTIDQNVPLDIDFKDLQVTDFDKSALEKLFHKLGFTRLLNQLGLEPAAPEELFNPTTTTAVSPVAQAESAKYILVDTQSAFEDFLVKLRKQKKFAIDTETTSIIPMKSQLVGLSFSWRAGEGYYLALMAPMGQRHLDREVVITALAPILKDPKIKKTGQNVKFDIVVLKRAGLHLEGAYFDTMLASYLIDSTRTRHNLDSLALDYLGHETIKIDSLIGKGKNQLTFDMVDTNLAADYSGEDAEVTWRLTEVFDKLFTDKMLRKLFDEVEIPLVAVLAQMEYHGVALDVAYLKKLSTRMSNRLDKLTDEIYQQAGRTFNIDSPKQLGEILFDKLKLTCIKRTKTGPSTDQESLEAIKAQHQIAALLLEYRQLSKLKNTYVDKLPAMINPATGRVHASFNQTVTATGRLSSSNPNLQNIPIRSDLGQEIRRAFIAQGNDNIILAADYSQIELRLLAHFSQDEALLSAFAAGEDIHRFVAAQVFNIAMDKVDKAQRGKAKAVNFGIIYGQTAYGLSRSIGIPVSEAKVFIEGYFSRYPKIGQFMDDVITQAKKDGYVRTILGRQRMLPDLASRSQTSQKLGERMAVNTVIQGSAADLIKVAMINIYKNICQHAPDLKMILQIHDELVFELPKAKAKEYGSMIREEMTTAIELNVPITVDIGIGPNWLECK